MKKNLPHPVQLCFSGFIDHFDTALYGFLAPLLAPLFFPAHSKTISLIFSYSVFATGLMARPFGIWLAHRSTEKNTILQDWRLSFFFVSLCIGSVGLLPTWDQIGFWAPVFLVFLRTGLDIAVSCERTLTRLLLLNQPSEKRVMRWSAVYQSLTMAGLWLALFSSHSAHKNWLSWRCLFLGAGCVTFLLFLWRFRAVHPDQALTHSKPIISWNPFQKNLWHKKILIMRIACLHGFSYATYAIPFLFMTAYVPLVTSVPAVWMTENGLWIAGFDLCVLILFGGLGSPTKNTMLMTSAAIALAASSIPLFYFLPHYHFLFCTSVRLWVVFWGVLFSAALPVWEKRYIPKQDWALALGTGKLLGSTLIGRNLTAFLLALHHCGWGGWGAGITLSFLSTMTLWAMRCDRKSALTS